MGRITWSIREWILRPVIVRQEIEMAKDKDALAQLKAMLDQQGTAIAAVRANVEGDEDTDYEAIRPLIEQAQRNNAELASLAGVSATVNPSLPVDAVTGEQVPDPAQAELPDEDDDDSEDSGNTNA